MGASPVPVVGTVSGPTSFRVSSFNILGYDHTARGGSKKGYADGALRMKWAVQLIKSHHVDVVGLQEFQPQQYAKWVKKASSQYDIFPGYIETVGFLRNSIAWRKDKPAWSARRGSSCRTSTVTCSGCRWSCSSPSRPASRSTHELPEPRRRPRQRPEVAPDRPAAADRAGQPAEGQQRPAGGVDRRHERQEAGLLPGHQAGGLFLASGGYRSASTCQAPSAW